MVKVNKKILTIIAIVLMLISITSSIYAATDQAGVFGTPGIGQLGGSSTASMVETIMRTRLGYSVTAYSDSVTSKSTVTSYINQSANNYAFSLTAKRNSSNGNPIIGSSTLAKNEISGNWHLVILNFPYSAADQSWANAFKTVGYTNRAFMGWYSSYDEVDVNSWTYNFMIQLNFYGAGSYPTLRDAALEAADYVSGSTPIRMYGDKTWNGLAW